MKTILLAGAVNQELSILTDGLPTGALHLAEQPLSAYAIKRLEAENAVIFIQSGIKPKGFIKKISPYLGWHTTLTGLDVFGNDQSDEILWIRDDVLYDLDFSKILANLRQEQNPFVAILVNNVPVMFYQKGRSVADQLKLPEFEGQMSTQTYCNELIKHFEWHTISLKQDQAIIIDTPKTFHTVAMSLLRGEYQHAEIGLHQENKKLVKGWHSHINKSSQLQNYAYLGDCTNVHKKSQLKDQVIVCKGSFIDEFVDIENSIVMPDVFVGSYLNIKNAIVTGTSVIRVDTGVTIPIEERKFTAKL